MVVTPRYSCTLCPRTDLLVQDMVLSGRVRKRDGRPAASWCRECNARKHRAMYHRDPARFRARASADYRFRRRVDPERLREQDREWKRRRVEREPERQAELEGERQRRYRERLRKDEARHEHKKFMDRLAYRRRQAALGRDPSTIKLRVRPKRDKSRVPAQPVWEVLHRYMLARGVGKEQVAELAGVSPRVLRRWELGQERTDYETADRVLTFLSLLPHDVWDEVVAGA